MNTTSNDYLSCSAVLASNEMVKTVNVYISDWLPTQDNASTVKQADFSTDWN